MENKFKPQMTFDEMAAAFAEDNPWFIPNNANVGRYAKKHGYMKIKQMINKVIVMKYVKA
ncbi:hypothetical protein E5358_05555 [Palleniella muris]|jgi:hypothetical protein|uniref:Uncharacterized protein n=1 Tax=Palleniella muris TaxID=3038145 RepID=A0AC61QRS0_9BACT|nr:MULTISPECIES: hypothetical protein [Prevotellaceae]TGX82803.1 hypothetical protein E5358_05555 [Palleniella muris]GAY31024.1 hypothetical protein PvtlMGM2_1877 [Prevotella sp. MGM2]